MTIESQPIWMWTVLPRERFTRKLERPSLYVDLFLTPRLEFVSEPNVVEVVELFDLPSFQDAQGRCDAGRLYDWLTAPLQVFRDRRAKLHIEGEMLEPQVRPKRGDNTQGRADGDGRPKKLVNDYLRLELVSDAQPDDGEEPPGLTDEDVRRRLDDIRKRWATLFPPPPSPQTRPGVIVAHRPTKAALVPRADVKYQIAGDVKAQYQAAAVGQRPDTVTQQRLAQQVLDHLGPSGGDSCDPLPTAASSLQRPNEFHRVISNLSKYPAVARSFGLILRARVRTAELDDEQYAHLLKEQRLAVSISIAARVASANTPAPAVATGSALPPIDACPLTRVEIGGLVAAGKRARRGDRLAFRPLRRTVDHVTSDGYLMMAGRYRFVQTDVLGAALKLGLFPAEHEQSQTSNPQPGLPIAPELPGDEIFGDASHLPPPLHSVGLSLLDADPHALTERIRRTEQLNNTVRTKLTLRRLQQELRQFYATRCDPLDTGRSPAAAAAPPGTDPFDPRRAELAGLIAALNEKLKEIDDRIRARAERLAGLKRQKQTLEKLRQQRCDPAPPSAGCEDLLAALDLEIRDLTYPRGCDPLEGDRPVLVDRLERLAKEQTLLARIHDLTHTKEAPAELFYEDLVRGFAIDVSPDRRAWRSLCCRDSTYHIRLPAPKDGKSHLALGIETADGYVAATLAHDPRGGTRANASFFHWDGYSLAAPLPTLTAQKSDEEATPETLWARYGEFPVVRARHAAHPGSLPRLRFGRHYYLAGRAIDLTGDGPALPRSFTDIPSETRMGLVGDDGVEHPYLRFQPVAAPVVIHRPIFDPGGACDPARARSQHMIVRSGLPSLVPDESAQAHLAPPPGSVKLAELHGMFDALAPADSYKLITDRSGAVTPRPVTDVDAIDPVSPAAAETFVTHQYLPDPLAHGVIIEGLPGDRPTVVIPFTGRWPDLNAYRLIVRPQLEDGTRTWEFDRRRRAVTVYLRPGEVRTLQVASMTDRRDIEQNLGIYQWLAEHRRSHWGKGALATPPSPPGAIGRKGPSGQQAQSQDPPVTDVHQIDECIARARASRHPMIHPRHSILLMHAYPRPIDPPRPRDLRLTRLRSLGDTGIDLAGTAAIHRRTTGKVELHAFWEEPIDLTNIGKPVPAPGAPADTRAVSCERELTPAITPEDRARGYVLKKHHASVRTVDVPSFGKSDPDQPFDLGQFHHVIGDTKAYRIRYRLTGSSPFVTHFEDRRQEVEPPCEPRYSPETTELQAFSSARPAAPRVSCVLPLIQTSTQVDTDNGVTLPATADTTAKARSVREAQPGRDLDLPQVVNAVETQRVGGGLRVFLAPPWWSTGLGEQLAVLYFPAKSNPVASPKDVSEDPDRQELSGIPADARPYVTQWGQDPVWSAAHLPPIDDSLFRGATILRDLSLEVPVAKPVYPEGCDPLPPDDQAPVRTIASRVCAAGYDVHYDPVRGMYYADILLNAGDSYFPFIKLAIARLQPSSVRDAELSHPIVAEFAQLLPDRAASVIAATQIDPGSEVSVGDDPSLIVDVAVSGSTYAASRLALLHGSPEAIDTDPDNFGLARMIVRVERLLALVDGVEQWVPDDQAVPFTRLDHQPREAPYTWFKQIKLSKPRGHATFRLTFEEYEMFAADSTPDRTRPLRPSYITGEVAARLVFATTLVLPADQRYFNTRVAELARQFRRGSYFAGNEPGSGFPDDIALCDGKRYHRDRRGVSGFGFTFYIFLWVLQEKRLLSQLSRYDIDDIARRWYSLHPAGADPASMVDVILACGAGTEILDGQKPAPGDFVQFRRAGVRHPAPPADDLDHGPSAVLDSEHPYQYGIFIGWAFSDNIPAGIRYRGISPDSDGMGEIETPVVDCDVPVGVPRRAAIRQTIRIARLSNEIVRWDLADAEAER